MLRGGGFHLPLIGVIGRKLLAAREIPCVLVLCTAVWGVNLIHKTVSAEGTGTVTVDAILDFSNVWVSKKSLKDIYDAKGKLIFNSATRDCYGCGNENWIYTPGDWFELKVMSAEIKTNSYGTKSFQIEYDGVYHHFHGYDHFTGDCYCKSWTTNLL